jgi:SsrA-binding protein
MGKKKSPIIAKNRRAWRDFDIEETIEAGLELHGSEVKSMRAGHVQFADSFAEFRGNELYLMNMHVAEYNEANQFNHSPTRSRKLLLHRSELDSLRGHIERGGMTLIPLDVHLSGRWVKVRLGLAKGRKKADKREAIKERMMKRDAERAMKEQGY